MKKKILFVNDEMTMGGVAHVLNTLLKMIDKDKYDVDFLVLHKRGELLREIPKDVNVIAGTSFFNTIDIPLKQCKGKQLFSKIRLLLYMKTGFIKNKIQIERKKFLNKQYDIEFAAKEGFCTIFSAFGDSKKKINWVQADYRESNYSSNHMKLVREALKKIDMNIACSDKVMESYIEVFGVKSICVIHNLIDEDRIRKMSCEKTSIRVDDNKINLIAVARFHKQKGLDRLLCAYAKLKDYYKLVVIGDGELKEKLYAQAKKLNCFDEIEWLGIRSNPYPDVRKSELFVMSSLYEGYPTMTIESLVCGTPVLTTKVAGVDEQITNGCGWIVDNSQDGLFDKLNELKESKKTLLTYKRKLNDYHYDNNSILKSYYKIFED